VASVVIGLALIVVARQLAHGNHRAWQAALVLFAAGAVINLLKGPHPILVLYRPRWSSRSSGTATPSLLAPIPDRWWTWCASRSAISWSCSLSAR
jgi:hypothetical protein